MGDDGPDNTNHNPYWWSSDEEGTPRLTDEEYRQRELDLEITRLELEEEDQRLRIENATLDRLRFPQFRESLRRSGLSQEHQNDALDELLRRRSEVFARRYPHIISSPSELNLREALRRIESQPRSHIDDLEEYGNEYPDDSDGENIVSDFTDLYARVRDPERDPASWFYNDIDIQNRDKKLSKEVRMLRNRVERTRRVNEDIQLGLDYEREKLIEQIDETQGYDANLRPYGITEYIERAENLMNYWNGDRSGKRAKYS
jgi:hypothetical protein